MEAGLSERLLPALPVLDSLFLVELVGVGGGLSVSEPGLLNRLTRADTDIVRFQSTVRISSQRE